MDRNQVISLMADVALGTDQIDKTFHIQTQRGLGTCFLYGNANGLFFLTAAHVLEGTMAGEKVNFRHEDGWIPRTITAIFVHPSGYDLAVFVTDDVITGEIHFDATFAVMPGQPMKFLGFPHGLNSNYPSRLGFMSPLVRTAYWSGIIETKGLSLNVLDGFNNPGYSGGPVFCCGEDGEPKLFGVISGYRWESEAHSKVYKKNEQGEFEPLEDYIVRPNSGMIYVVGKGEYDILLNVVDQFQPRAD
jgi:hypothetical protein